MSFCTECGFSLDTEASQGKFCPECGNLLAREQETINDITSINKSIPQIPKIPDTFTNTNVLRPKLPPVPGSQQNTKINVEDESKRLEIFQNGFDSYGIIFTDTRKIAKQCRTTSNDIYNILNNYCQNLKKFGHQYIIYDIDSTRYKDHSWQIYVEELSNFYAKQRIQPQYLFIIGSSEIIPMPVFDNLSDVDVPDYDYDTDIPYSYLKSFEIEDMIWDGSLYYEDVKLHVGRLPFGEDFQKIHLTNYLNKIVSALEDGFEIQNCFGLSAEGWQDASETVLDNLEVPNKYIDFSPSVSINDIDDIFDETSDILYFNLHGSDAPEQPQFFGDWDPAISPEQISKLVKNNIIITEACYGAKFIGYDTSNSMLLNSIHQNTLAYFGSSRIAFGSSTYFLFSADVIAHSVLGSLSNNLTVGQALSKARIDNIQSVEDEDDFSLVDLSLVTAIEFNLYGDPSLKSFNKKPKLNNSPSYFKALKQIPNKIVKEEIYNKKSNQNILEAVRSAVDLEFDKISKIIQKELYDKYDLKSDELQKITYQKSQTNDEYLYVYSKKQKNVTKNKLYFINCSKSGSIKKVITSK